MGSSPRMRGTLLACFQGCADGGIIPAYAGRTHMDWLHDLEDFGIIPAYAGNTLR